MKKILMAVAAITLMMTMTVLTSCTDNSEYNPVVVTDDKPFTYDQYIDTSVRPGDDFFRYQYGMWLADNQQPSLVQMVMQKLNNIEMEVIANSNDAVVSSIRQLVAASESDDSADMALLKERIQYLADITTQDELLAAFKQLHQWGYSPVVRLVCYGKERVISPFLTSELPSVLLTDIFNGKNEDMLTTTVQVICSKLDKFGISEERIAEIAENALTIEKMEMKIYENIFNRMADPKVLHKRARTRGTASSACKQVCELMGIGDLADKMLDSDDQNIAKVTEQLMNLLLEGSEQSIAQMRDYMIAYVFGMDVIYMPKVIKLSSSDKVKYAMRNAKYYISRLQVEHIGKQNIFREKCAEMMEDLRSILRERIEHLDWMSTATKQAAQKKLENMIFFIGYPDQWNEEFTPVVEGNTLLEAVGNLRRGQVDAFRKMVGKDITTAGWEFWYNIYSFTTYNASYDPNCNQLIIPPSFLMAPVFDATQNEATLYGTACVFGHEMCHGFDSRGSQFDEVGTERNWWAPDDEAAFKEKQQQLVRLWGDLEQYPGQPANGVMTLRENMADYGGTTLALEAYSRRLRKQGFTGRYFDEQIKKFWLSRGMPVFVAEAERSLETLENALYNDIHSAGHNRVNGIVRLFDDWYRLYDVQPTDKLYLKPEDRVMIW